MARPIQIKNCGLSSIEQAHMAIKSGAHFLGFVHHTASPRHLPLSAIASLTSQIGARAKNVIVVVKPDHALLEQIKNLRDIHYLQIHGVQEVAQLQAFRVMAAKKLIVAMGIANIDDITRAQALAPHADHLLLDHKTPQHGGSGSSFDWQLVKHNPLQKPWFLAGGLTAENVGEAMRVTGAKMLDVSSGIEDAPGKKSLEKIAAFNVAVLSTAHD
jgi:phosphoribosylanthranilate isomerase